MVMRPDPRAGALTRVRGRRWGPWWLWTTVAILAASTAYAGLWARSATQQLAQTELARALLAANRTELQSDRLSLEGQLKHAHEVETKLRADLDRSRADGNAVAALVGKLQKQVTGLRAELTSARAAVAESEKTVERLTAKAASADTAAEQVAKLQEHLAALKSERDAARTDVAKAAEEKSTLERQLADLKDELTQARAKLAPAMTGTTPAPAP